MEYQTGQHRDQGRLERRDGGVPDRIIVPERFDQDQRDQAPDRSLARQEEDHDRERDADELPDLVPEREPGRGLDRLAIDRTELDAADQHAQSTRIARARERRDLIERTVKTAPALCGGSGIELMMPGPKQRGADRRIADPERERLSFDRSPLRMKMVTIAVAASTGGAI